MENEADFFDVQAWGKLAEGKAAVLLKGKQVLASGRLKQDRWEKDGQSHSRVILNADTIIPLADPKGTAQAHTTAASKPTAAPPSADEFTDDIPF